MIALDLNLAVLHRATGAAGRLQTRGERLEIRVVQRQTGNHRNTFALSPGSFASDSNLTGRTRARGSASNRRRRNGLAGRRLDYGASKQRFLFHRNSFAERFVGKGKAQSLSQQRLTIAKYIVRYI